ncbi:MAG TPA: class II aldolase/adducin family protein [Acidobacteriota bacterium]|nr:class II aldolase/adducin family protein [Acidobacteriota bacterium]
MSEEIGRLKEQIVDIGARLYTRGYVVAADGNISARLADGNILTTPSGLCKGTLTPEQILLVDAEGRVLEGGLKPSSEIKMHVEAYRQRADIKAIVHAHPPISTGFSCAGEPLDKAILAEVILTLGCVPIARYGTPSTEQVAESIRELIKLHDGILLANHGALTVGPDLMNAYFKMETIEHFAKISLVTRILGRENVLTSERVGELERVGRERGIAVPALECDSCPRVAESPERYSLTRDELIELLEHAIRTSKRGQS